MGGEVGELPLQSVILDPAVRRGGKGEGQGGKLGLGRSGTSLSSVLWDFTRSRLPECS